MIELFQNAILFEDVNVRRFGAVALLRPVWALRSGAGILRERTLSGFKTTIHRWVRPHLVEWQRVFHPGTIVNEALPVPALFVNGRLLSATPLFVLPTEGTELTVVAAFLKPDNQLKILNSLTPEGFTNESWMDLNIPVLQVDDELDLICHPFDLLVRQEREIEETILNKVKSSNTPSYKNQNLPAVWVNNPEQLFLHPTVKIGMQSVLDASEGPIWIGEGTTIEGHAYLKGPLAIGSNCYLRAGIKLYGPSSIGPVCKLGGEIQKSLWMGYANKQHDGYIGTSVIGSWVNIGAGTNNSDLKNTYGPVTITIAGERIETGEVHIGALLGDHTKTSIGLQLNTGTVTGIACNLFGSGFPPTYIPSFAWGGADWLIEHSLPKAIETARIAMSRRNREMVPAIEEMFRTIFNQTIPERAKYLKRKQA